MHKEERIFTEGSILKAIWRLGWPAMTSMFFETFLSITDAIWVGRLGAVEMAAVTSSMFPVWTFFSLLLIMPTGVLAIISRAIGARRPESVRHSARQSLLLAIILGIGFSVIGLLISRPIFELMNTEAEVTAMGINYLRIFFIGAVFFVINETFSGIFRAAGDPKAHLIGSTVAILINVALDPLLIFGLGPFPKLGTSGASIATVCAAACGTAVYMVMITRGRLGYRLNFRLFEKLDFRLAAKIIKIGFPPAISGVVFSVVYIFLNRIVSDFGTTSIAALMIGHRMESLSFLTSFGISMAASTLVGQNLGAGKISRAERSAWLAVAFSVLITTAIGLLFLIIPRQLSLVFIQDEAVIDVAVNYLRILALSQMFMAVEIVMEGAFAGAGNTVPPMAVSITGSFARLPMAYLLCYILGLGINGVWWTITITTWIKALIMGYWFWRGQWKKTGLIQT